MNQATQLRQQVRDALMNLYDPVRLEVHPLLRHLGLDHGPSGSRARALREHLIATIEDLRPDEHIPFNDAAWLPYRILRERYIDAADPPEVWQSLGLSRTTFYRYHHDALDALARILWREQQEQEDAPAPTTDEAATREEQAVQEALRVARSSDAQRLNVNELMQSAQSMIKLMAERAESDIALAVAENLPCIDANATVLRQVLLNLLSEVLKSVRQADCLLQVSADAGSVRWCLSRAKGALPSESQLRGQLGIKVSQALVELYGGQLWFEQQGEVCTRLCFALPISSPKTILIIDDNPALTELYSRYLAGRDCSLFRAHSAAEAQSCLTRIRPDLILLDVLMPNEDGWLVLRKLKESPETKSIPVVICSVLDQPDVATALGAEAVLQKPVLQEQLLELLDQLLLRGADLLAAS